MLTFLRYAWLMAVGKRMPAQALHFFNYSSASRSKRIRVLKVAMPGLNKKCTVEGPLFVERFDQLSMGNGAFLNTGANILNSAMVTIGDGAHIGPTVQFCTTYHHSDPDLRASDPSAYAKPITIGKNVWIGAGAILLPGVTIGDDALVAAGSVVTCDVAPRTVVAGSPATAKRTYPHPNQAAALARNTINP
ncbi:acetyltransferase [Ralstonia sp. A12]|nr:acetyltransferase [Ralstonia sp. A12]